MGGNANVFFQAKYLNDYSNDFRVEVLTWPKLDLWSGPVPAVSSRPKVLTTKRDGLTYYVFRAPDKYEVIAGGAELSEDNWEQAVAYGMQLLSKIIPDIVHLQHRHGFWWILESAQRLGIATVYTNHDWGIPCMRTVLVMGNNQLCDGVVETRKCASCIKSGRSSLLGRMNEELVSHTLGERLACLANKLPVLGGSQKARLCYPKD